MVLRKKRSTGGKENDETFSRNSINRKRNRYTNKATIYSLG